MRTIEREMRQITFRIQMTDNQFQKLWSTAQKFLFMIE